MTDVLYVGLFLLALYWFINIVLLYAIDSGERDLSKSLIVFSILLVTVMTLANSMLAGEHISRAETKANDLQEQLDSITYISCNE
jgi:hypothetical protein